MLRYAVIRRTGSSFRETERDLFPKYCSVTFFMKSRNIRINLKVIELVFNGDRVQPNNGKGRVKSKTGYPKDKLHRRRL